VREVLIVLEQRVRKAVVAGDWKTRNDMNEKSLRHELWRTSPGLPEVLESETFAEISAEGKAHLFEAEETLKGLAEVFFRGRVVVEDGSRNKIDPEPVARALNVEERYRALVEQIPAVVFMAYLDQGVGEAYVSPQIEEALGFSQTEWLEDPMRWYQQIHPDDKQRWSAEAAEMFLSGQPLRSAYRVMARDGRVRWFHCEAKMIRREDGQPWFIHGVGVDITELKSAESELEQERNVLSAILDTVGALVVVLDPRGRIVRFNRACEQTTGYAFADVKGKFIWELFLAPEEVEGFKALLAGSRMGRAPADYESHWLTREGVPRLISWSTTVLRGQGVAHTIATGIDVTERKQLEKAILEVSAREQRRIGQDLHDGLGQHLTGIAFLSKVLEEKLSEESEQESADAAKIVRLVNDAIRKTKELARGLLPVVSDAEGLMAALRQCAEETEDLFRVSCRFECDAPVLINDVNVATHLYHIAREAMNNALKHGRAKELRIRLAASAGEGTLSIRDDGVGMPKVPERTGMGLNIMNYRARMVGGSLEVRRNAERGVTVFCFFPLPSVAKLKN
jgi:PAS domain S-box-containing protein